MKQYYVYILASRSRNLYIGVTNDLEPRVYEHKKKLVPGFTAKYNIDRLVHFETTEDVQAAIAREKQIKGWLRSRKVSLIESVNPTWDDLSVSWVEKTKEPWPWAKDTKVMREKRGGATGDSAKEKADPSLAAQDDRQKLALPEIGYFSLDTAVPSPRVILRSFTTKNLLLPF